MIDEDISQVAEQLISSLRDNVDSILYYPYPFPQFFYLHEFPTGGFVVVLKDEVASVVALLATAYNCVPIDTSLHCLRRSELFELSLPVFWYVSVVDKHTHLAYWLKYKGVVLYGEDIRDEITLPADPRILLNNKIEVSMHFVRVGIILQLLVEEEYLQLIERLERQLKYLMAVALLVHGEWDVGLETVADKFARFYPDEQLQRTWEEFTLILNGVGAGKPAVSRETAFETVWLYETFLRRLREQSV